MKHLCYICYEYTHYVGRKKVMESCKLLDAHINKYLAGHGRLHVYADELCDYVEATLNTEEDNIQNVLSAMMSDLPEGCMREGLEGSYSYTYQTPRHQLKVRSFRHHKFDEKPGEKKNVEKEGGVSPSHDPRVRKAFRDIQLQLAHDASFRNRAQIERSKQCGCFSCCRIFPASEVTDYVSPEEPTAICPYCHIDSVIGDASGYPVTEEFMKEMNKRWF